MPRIILAFSLAAIVACGSRTQRPAANDTSQTTASGSDAAAPASAVPLPASTAAATYAQLSPDSMRARADRGRIRGNATAPIWIVEVSDFQCPYCRQWHEETYGMVIREYVERSRVRLAYLNLPIQTHAHAWNAAEAAMCAGVQGKFWQYHDGLFQTQKRWSALASPASVFDSLARAVGVDAPAWRSCLTSQAMRALIAQDIQRVEPTGVRSTPTFFIGDTAVVGALPAEVFRTVIESQLRRASTTPNR